MKAVLTTDSAILLGRFPTADAPTPMKGVMYFDTDDNKYKVSEDGASWIDVSAGGGSGATTALDNLTTTAINADLTFDKLIPVISTANKTGSDNSETLLITTGTTEDGTPGEINLTTAYPTGIGTRSGIRTDSAFLSIFAEGLVTAYAGTRYSFASDGGLELIPGGSTTPILKLYEGTATYFTTLKATDTGGLRMDGEGSLVDIGLATGLLPDTWGTEIPGIQIDGTTAIANAANAAGIIFKGGQHLANFIIATQDRSDANVTAPINIYTGASTGNKGTGSIYTATGFTDSSEDTGGFTWETGGNAGAGNSGGFSFLAGAAGALRGDFYADVRAMTASLLASNDGAFRIISSDGSGSIPLRLHANGTGNYVGLKSPATLSAAYTLTLPVDDGTPGQLLSTDGSGILSWATASAGANTALSNLITTAINQDLLPATDYSNALGSATKQWSEAWAGTTYFNEVRIEDSSVAGTFPILLSCNSGDLQIYNTNTDSAVWLRPEKAVKRSSAGSTSYIEEEYIHSITLAASQTNTVIADLTYAHAAFEGVEITYKIKEATALDVRTGRIIIANNGTVAVINDNYVDTGDVGITFDVNISGANVEIDYTSGANICTMRCDIKRIAV